MGRKTSAGALTAVGAYLANDLRDPEGLARPVLRRAAQALAASRRAALHKAGAAYLRLDPPASPALQPVPERDEIIDATIVEVLEPEEEARG